MSLTTAGLTDYGFQKAAKTEHQGGLCRFWRCSIFGHAGGRRRWCDDTTVASRCPARDLTDGVNHAIITVISYRGSEAPIGAPRCGLVSCRGDVLPSPVSLLVAVVQQGWPLWSR